MIDPDISELNAYLGEYEKSLYSTLFNELDALTDLTLVQDCKDDMTMTELEIASGARPGGGDSFEPRGAALKYSNRVLSAKLGKRELRINPMKFRSTWMTKVMKPGVNPMDIPFEGDVMDQVFKGLAAELNDQTTYFGFDKADAVEFDSGDAYVVGDYVTFDTPAYGTNDYYKCVTNASAGQTPATHPAKWQLVNAEAIAVGLGIRVLEAIAARPGIVESTGAITDADAYAQFTDVWRKLPVPYKQRGAQLFASWSSVDCLADDFENKVSKYTEKDAKTGKIYLAKTDGKCEIVRASWMGNSGRLICTPKANLLVGTDRFSDLNKVRSIEQMYTLDMSINFTFGTQIRDYKAMATNDQA